MSAARPILSLLLMVLWLSPVPGRADGPGGRLEQRQRARERAQLVRAGRSFHRLLVDQRVPLPLPPSDIVPDELARKKTYGSGWTCRSSSRRLIQQLGQRGLEAHLGSSGRDVWSWGAEGVVDYHYYVLDHPQRPSVLMDPTAVSNFQVSVRPGGVLVELLRQAGQNLAAPNAAERVAARLAGLSGNDLLILARPDEIAVYRGAIELAAARAR